MIDKKKASIAGRLGYTAGVMRHLLLLASCLLCVLSTPACAAGQAPVANGSVWKVEGGGSRIYLCGTIHLLREKDFPLSPSYDVAYNDCQRVVFELPPGSQHDPRLAELMRDAGSYPEGTQLQEKIKPQTWQAFNAWCQKRGVPADPFKQMRPWLAALTVAATEYAAVGAVSDRGVDFVFEERMQKDHKAGDGLETVDFQIGLFSKLTEAQQASLLEQTLTEVKTLPNEFERMIGDWRNGDIEDLNKMMFAEAKNYPDLMDIFLINRNKSWIKKLEGYLAKPEHVMVLVGAGHLGGDTGVIAMLKARGYKVSQVTAAEH